MLKTINSPKGCKRKPVSFYSRLPEGITVIGFPYFFPKTFHAYTNTVIHISVLKNIKREHVICIALYPVF